MIYVRRGCRDCEGAGDIHGCSPAFLQPDGTLGESAETRQDFATIAEAEAAMEAYDDSDFPTPWYLTVGMRLDASNGTGVRGR